MPKLLEANDIVKTYYVKSEKGFFKKVPFTALGGVSISLEEGKTLGLIGESGCGKSTLGQIIARLLEPDSGEVCLEGVNLLEKNAPFNRHAIQMVFQDPGGALNPGHRLAWILHEALRAKKVKTAAERDKIIREIMPKVGLGEDYLTRYPHELSGGQKQRVAILLALLMEPRLIVADEVVSALDVSVRSQILNLLLDLQKSFGVSYLFISHDLNIVYYMSHDIAVMYLGDIMELGSADTVYHHGRHPYTQLLLSSSLDYEGAGGVSLVESAGDIMGRVHTGTGCRFAGRCPHTKDICKSVKPDFAQVQEGHFVRCHLAHEDLAR